MSRSNLVASSLLLLCLGGCDNVGRAFDPNVDPGGSDPGSTESTIQIVRARGDAREGRPKIKSIAPEGGGWPVAVPIVIEFTESVNEASIAPTSPAGTDGRIALRVQGAPQVLPCLYDFLAGGKVLVMRPATALSDEQNPTYEVVMFPDARDVDGVRFQVTGDEKVLTSFQVNQSASITDGRILALCPRDNKTDAIRESDYYVVFDRPANADSIRVGENLILRTGGAAIDGRLSMPLKVVGEDDPRVVRFRPDSLLAAGARYELVVDDTITFGVDGRLEFRGRSPYAVFETIGPQAPTAVHVGNPTTGFADKINRQNLGGLRLHVTVAADTQSGDTVVARIYGGDRQSATAGDVAFAEATAIVPAPGAQDVVIDFGTQLGSLDSPKFEDGGVTFCAQLRRGSQQSGFMQGDAGDEPVFDVTEPTVLRVGPPGSTAGFDVYTDLESLALYGTASEQLSDATLTDGVNPEVHLFAANADGFFMVNPVPLGRLLAARSYVLNITDLAGNLAAAAITGNIVQRGGVTGTLAGTLTVEAYDHDTLLPIAGARVLVDAPAAAQRTAVTDANGIATFAGLATTLHTITIVQAGYDLVTMLETMAANVSLPLRPMGQPVTNFQGTVLPQPLPGGSVAPGTTALVGNNAIQNPIQLGIATTATAPTSIPATPITPGRPQIVTAFAGVFEPVATPTFAFSGFHMLGTTQLVPAPPLEPAVAGGTSEAALLVIPSTETAVTLAPPFTKDFALAAGLDTANLLDGAPMTRVMASMLGFGGQVLGGVGYVTPTTGSAYSINASYGLPILAGFAGFAPYLWVATQARDTGGRVSRHRALIFVLLGSVIDVVPPPSIPVITVPGGPFAGPPLITFDDVLDPTPVPGGVAVADLTAQDSNGRRWVVMLTDDAGVGGLESVQFPDLSTANVTGLASGDWSVWVEARVLMSIPASSRYDFMLSERIRQEVTYSRAATQTITVQ
ncbi:MAG: carboxypeptidase regulatory-like domain-containing protein [Planctomycetes bacterium]|nr:carboxypeptidase regulatory-like domain-containing protein [Planctomycetota bacterium]